MANKERNKRSARKARAAEREAKAAAQGLSPEEAAATPVKAEAKKDKAVVKKDGIFSKIKNYLHDVKVEMSRVVWPGREELISYTVAVIGMLIVVGLVVWAVDSGLVALLLGYTGLRG